VLCIAGTAYAQDRDPSETAPVRIGKLLQEYCSCQS
jgi:hypothetical protein